MRHFLLFILALININISAQIGFGKSGSCNVNVNCSEGSAWSLQKRSIVRIFAYTDSIRALGTGVLLNNTRNDYTPYVLTAYHVIEQIKPKDFDKISFYFNYESPGCESLENDKSINKQVITGFKLIAFSDMQNLDFALVKLNQNIPKEFNPYFAGWTKLENNFTSGVCIHHPRGDIKKISTIASIKKDSLHYWNIKFKQTKNGYGITEGGSSGSPIFNEEGLVVGTLSGGQSDCFSLNGIDNFVRFSINSDNKDTLHNLKRWIDPDNIGIQTLQGIAEKPNTINTIISSGFSLYPNPCKDYINIKYDQKKVPSSIRLYDRFGRTISCKSDLMAGQQLITLYLYGVSNGVYLLSLDYGSFQINRIIIKQ